jgi:hypothetical protein
MNDINLNATLDQAYRAGYLKKANLNTESEKLHRSVKVLRQRLISNDTDVRFLAKYDLLFRCVEFQLLKLGYSYASSAHRIFRDFYSLFFIFPAQNCMSLGELSEIRHSVKKSGQIPSAFAQTSIDLLFQVAGKSLPNE